MQGRASAYSGQPGYFRLTFTLRPDYFEVGLARLEDALGLERTQPVSVNQSAEEGVGQVVDMVGCLAMCG